MLSITLIKTYIKFGLVEPEGLLIDTIRKSVETDVINLYVACSVVPLAL